MLIHDRLSFSDRRAALGRDRPVLVFVRNPWVGRFESLIDDLGAFLEMSRRPCPVAPRSDAGPNTYRKMLPCTLTHLTQSGPAFL